MIRQDKIGTEVRRGEATEGRRYTTALAYFCGFAFLILVAHFVGGGILITPDGLRFTLFDDAMISLRYAHNFAAEGKLYWSASSVGVEGFTNFLWTLIMAIPCKILPLGLAPLGVSLLSIMFLFGGFRQLSSWKNSPWNSLPAVSIAVAIVASTPLLFWSLRGFETALLFFLFSAFARSFEEAHTDPAIRKQIVPGIIIVCGVFTRDDFAVILGLSAALLAGFQILKKERPGFPLLIVFVFLAVAMALKTAYRGLLFHDVFPNTYYLKVFGHDRLAMASRGMNVLLRQLVGWMLGPMLFCLTLFLLFNPRAVVEMIVLRFKQIRSSSAFPFFILLSSLAYSVLVGGDAWEWSGLSNRYICMILPFVALELILFVHAMGSAIFKDDSAKLERTAPRRAILAVFGSFVVFWAFFWAIEILLDALQLRGKYDGLITGPDYSMRDYDLWFQVAFIGLCFIGVLWRFDVGYRKAVAGGVEIALLVTALLPTVASAGHGFKYFHIQDDVHQAQLSYDDRKVIGNGQRVLAAWAGTYPYYLPDADFIDPFGKMEKHIARMKSKWPFWPGHTKWDYDYVLKKYEPLYVVGTEAGTNKNRWLMDKTSQWEKYRAYNDHLLKRIPVEQ